MRRLWLTWLLLVFSVSPCLVLTGCGPSEAERKETEQQEIENEDQYTDSAEDQSAEEE